VAGRRLGEVARGDVTRRGGGARQKEPASRDAGAGSHARLRLIIEDERRWSCAGRVAWIWRKQKPAPAWV